MILSVHLLAGAAVGAKIGNPWLVALISFIGHFVLDALPHSEYDISAIRSNNFGKKYLKELIKVGVDSFFGVSAVIYLAFKTAFFWPVIVGAFFAILPDFLTLLSFFSQNIVLKKIYRFHAFIHFSSLWTRSAWQKTSIQLLIFLAIFSYLARL